MYFEDLELIEEVGMSEDLLPFEKVKRELIIKKEAKINPEFGCMPEERSVEKLIQYGIVNINKPVGPT